ncbi:MAG: hypothetical protein DDT32_01056 [Syntrophomonadaceae bacterium]|nr:hypothetical protein [Bacillota bacterium]
MRIIEEKEWVKQRITQHKRFVPYGTHPNPSLRLGLLLCWKRYVQCLWKQVIKEVIS